VVSPYDEEVLKMRFTDSDNTTIEASKSSVPVELGTVEVENSIAPLLFKRLRFTLHYDDHGSESDYAYDEIRALPFQAFTLNANGTKVELPGAIQKVGDKQFRIEFNEFTIPLTESQPARLTISSKIAHFIPDGATFHLELDPGQNADVKVVNEETGHSEFQTFREPSQGPITTVINTESITYCIDTDSTNIHCNHYLKSRNIADNRHSAARTEKQKKEPKQQLSRAEKREQAKEVVENASAERAEKLHMQYQEKQAGTLGNHLEKVLQRLQYKLDPEKFEQVKAALQASHKKPALASVERKNKMIMLLKSKLAAEQRKVKLAAAQKLSVAERINSSRLDSDRDGLRDSEEMLIGTDPYKADTDDDGYSDYTEVEYAISPFLHNPKPIFSDIKGSVAAGSISRLYYFGALQANETGGKFLPKDSTNRLSAVITLSRLFAQNPTSRQIDSPFGDVKKSDWYLPQLIGAIENEAIEVDEQKAFRPFEPVTKAELCKMMLAYLQIKITPERNRPLRYSDTKTPNEDYAAERCHTLGLLAESSAPKSAKTIEEPAQSEDAEPTEKHVAATAGVFGTNRRVSRENLAKMATKAIRIYEKNSNGE
jgi:hypothetical protein